MPGNLLVIHGGAPTPVINASLYGVIRQAGRHSQIEKVLGAIGGVQADHSGRFANLSSLPQEKLELLLSTPASIKGSSRDHVTEEDYEKMAGAFLQHNIRFVLLNGGNGTMDTCKKIHDRCKDWGITIVGIPKTIDNDISATDHTPGYGSAARYIAATTAEISQDLKSLPIHMCVMEVMGRDTGWIAAASVLARRKPEDAPHLIYTPELPFDEEGFIKDVKALHDENGYGLVLVSEGLRDKEGKSIVPPIFQAGRAVYFGDTSTHLAGLIIRKLGIKARSEKPGICGRASSAWQSEVDRDEAIQAGSEAVKAAAEGCGGVMVAMERMLGRDYQIKWKRIPIEPDVLKERAMPREFINEKGNGITQSFVDYCRPLIGSGLLDFFELEQVY